jgi:hypothetical protein
MWLHRDAIRCPELAAGEGQNQPQLRIMLGNCPQVNEKKGQYRKVEAGGPRQAGWAGRTSPQEIQKEKGPKNSGLSRTSIRRLLVQGMAASPLRHNLASIFSQ